MEYKLLSTITKFSPSWWHICILVLCFIGFIFLLVTTIKLIKPDKIFRYAVNKKVAGTYIVACICCVIIFVITLLSVPIYKINTIQTTMDNKVVTLEATYNEYNKLIKVNFVE